MTHKMKRFSRIIYLTSACLIFCPNAYAQTAEGDPSSNGPDVGEIVVTAQKRLERLVDVPTAVTALSTDTLAAKGAMRFEDYQAYVPGLSTTPVAPGFNQIQLRGVTTGADQLSATVATYYSDTPTNSSSSIAFGSKLTPDPDLLDVARIEILRGPQGTLYGANALGGVIRYILVEPDPSGIAGHVEAGVSSVDHGATGFLARGAVNAPLVDGKLAVRISGFYTRDPGYIDHISTGRNNVARSTNWGGRFALRWQPNDAFSATLSSLYQHRNNDGKSSESVGQDLRPQMGAYHQAVATDEFVNTRYQLHTLSLDVDLGFADLVSATGYGRQKSYITGDQSELFGALFPIPRWRTATFVDLKKFSQEFRLSSHKDEPLEYIAGVYYTHERSFASSNIHAVNSSDPDDLAAFPALFDATIASRYREMAVFANLTYNFSERFNIQAGGRWSHNNQRFAEGLDGLVFGPAAGTRLNYRSRETAWTFAVAPQFKITPDFNIYARVAKGFRPGGSNLVTPGQIAGGINSSYNSDTLINYEVGAKAIAFDKRLSLSLAGFRIDWKDIQTAAFDGPFYYLLNGGKARSSGVEAEARWHAGGLTVSGNLSYVRAKTRDPIPAVGALAGDALPYSPRWSGAVAADYQFALHEGFEASLGGGLRYLGNRQAYYSQATASNPGNLRIDDNVLLDVHAALRRGPYQLSLFVQNLTDKRAVLSVQTEATNPITGDGWRATIARPRTIGATLGVDF